jgi:hypothetical protein
MNRSASLPDFFPDVEVPDEFEARAQNRKSSSRRWRNYLGECERQWLRSVGKHNCLDFLDAERKALRDIFQQLDADESSKISTDELIDHLVSLGIIENEDGLKRALSNIGEASELQKTGLSFKQFGEMVLKSGVELPLAFQAIMYGRLGVENAEHKNLRSVITEYRRMKILGAMTGADMRGGLGVSGSKILRNYSGLINRRGQLTQSDEQQLSAVQLASLWRNFCREANLVPAHGKQNFDNIPESPRSVIQKVGMNYKRQEKLLPVFGTTPESVIHHVGGRLLQEYHKPTPEEFVVAPTLPTQPEGWYPAGKRRDDE